MLSHHEEIELYIDENLFAPEPPRWLVRWRDWGYKHKPKDQCDGRNRLIWAFTLKLFLGLVYYLFRFISRLGIAIVAILIFTYRPQNICWKGVWNLNYTSDMFMDKGDKNFWFASYTTKEEGLKYREFYEWFILCPFFWLVFAAIYAFLISDLLVKDISAVDVIIFLFFSAITILVITGIFAVLFHSWDKIEDKIGGWKENIEDKKQRQFEAELANFYEQEIEPLACLNRSRTATIEDLPPKKRTLYLRFRDLKAKVCKPYRQGW